MNEKFDARAAWARLTPAQQAELGPIFMLLGYLEWASCEVDPQSTRTQGFEAALWHAEELRDIGFGSTLRTSLASHRIGAPPALPDLNVFGIRQCRICGCTDQHACPGGCSWAAEDLCSRCSPY